MNSDTKNLSDAGANTVERAMETCVDATRDMVTILSGYRSTVDFDSRLDAWMRKYCFAAFTADKARGRE